MCLAIPGKVMAIEEGALRMARVAFGEVVKEVSLACVPDARIGDHVIAHAGFAIERLDEEAARDVFAYLAELDAAEEA